MSTGAEIDTDELVDETGVEPKDIELIMSQVTTSAARGRRSPPSLGLCSPLNGLAAELVRFVARISCCPPFRRP